MSSNDRYTRSNRPRQAPSPAEPVQDDEIVSEDQWGYDPDLDDMPPSRQPVQTDAVRPEVSRQRGAPGTYSVDGTAAQIDRLRSTIRQSARPSTQRPPARNNRQPSGQAARSAPMRDDQVVADAASFDSETYRPSSRPQPSSARTRPRTTAVRGNWAADEDSFDDDDPYVDYDSFEDDFSEYDAPRRPQRQARPRPRPRPQFTMPAMSRPSLPPAIARADLVNDAPALGIIGAGLASLAAMAIVVANQAESLAPQFATHVSASGILENFQDYSALWNVPLMAAMFTLMNIIMAWFISPLDRFASRFVLVGALVAQFMAWVAIIRIL